MNKEEIKTAQTEVRKKAGVIAQIAIRIFFSKMNPLVPLKDFNSLIHLYLKEINPKEGKFVGTNEQLKETFEMMRWNHKRFDNAKAETVYILAEFPELSLHESLIYEYIKSKR
jgi:hypothetical protein